MNRHFRTLTSLILSCALWLSLGAQSAVARGEVLGMHILHPDELSLLPALFTTADQEEKHDETWRYVTIPLALDDLDEPEKWQTFMDAAQEQKSIPVVRLVSKFDGEAWVIPNRKNIVDQLTFLRKLTWPTDKKHVIIYNEVNHAKEWGGELDPASYAAVLEFAGSWAHSENAGFVVLPAAMDLAAPNGSETLEAFGYLEQMVATNPDVLSVVDVWNSHSYPNPGFSAAPTRTGQNSLRGFEHELAWLQRQTGRDFQVLITETGWEDNRSTSPWLESYYTYALQHIWSDSRILGVTPFVLRGDPGPFSGFAFLDREGKPTLQYLALQKALKAVGG